MAASTSGALVNWMSRYSTTWMWLPQGSMKSSPRAGQDLGARLLERPAQRRPVVDHEAEMAVLVLRLRAAGRERDELIAHVDERHARAPAAQRELEQPAVEGQRRVDVADLECHVVEADQTRLGGFRSHGRYSLSNTSRSRIAETV